MARLARRQWSVVTAIQMLGLGFSRDEIGWLLRRGRLHRLYPGVYAVGHPDVPHRGKLLAATLACGDGAFLSHASAAADRHLRPSHPYRVELTVPAGHTPKRPGLTVHRTRTAIDRSEVTRYHGILVATVPRILIDLAPRETPKNLQELITAAVRRRQFDPETMEAAMRRHAHRPGVGLLKAAAARYRPHPDRKSGLERSFDRWRVRHPQVPDPAKNVWIGGWEIDCAWYEQRVTLELDGRDYHSAIQDQDKDRRKDRELQILGWRVMRTTDFEWEYDRARVVLDLCALLGVEQVS